MSLENVEFLIQINKRGNLHQTHLHNSGHSSKFHFLLCLIKVFMNILPWECGVEAKVQLQSPMAFLFCFRHQGCFGVVLNCKFCTTSELEKNLKSSLPFGQVALKS